MKYMGKKAAELGSILAKAKQDGSTITAEAEANRLPWDAPIRKWSMRNQILCIVQGAKSGDCRGIRQWNRAGRKVKRGSKALYILIPCTGVKDTSAGDKEPVVYGFKAAAVFDKSQTEPAQAQVEAPA